MNHKTYLKTVGSVFLVIAVLHLLRAIYGWEAVINGYTLPMWLSWAAVLLAGFLAYKGLKGMNI